MTLLAMCIVVGISFGDIEPPQASSTPQAADTKTAPLQFAPDHGCNLFCDAASRPAFLSDHDFDGFIGPITNPILSKDPRSNTYLRPMFINNRVPSDHPLGGGNAQIYAMQANLAINERLSIIADKDGFANYDTNGFHSSGWLNLAAGLKYTFLRDVENQTLGAAGFLFEIPTGESNALQGHGSGVFTAFLVGGQQFCDSIHVLNTLGYQFPVSTSANSSFIYNSFHIDKAFGGWFYPLMELNLFYYTGGGDRFPGVVGEGDGLLNLGTADVSGNTLLTLAFGAKAKLSCNVELGAAYEFSLVGRKDLNDGRLVTELILRY